MTECNLRLRWASITDFDGLFDRLLAGLPVEEHERALRFRIDDARHRFVLGRTILRRSLGADLGVDPGVLEFATGKRGKPHLAFPELENPPHFNLSHSGDLVVLAISGVRVGADIERLRAVPNAEKLAHRFFSPGEREKIFELEGGCRDAAFLRIWTQKEAYLKATGIGVGMPLREVETEPDPSASPRLHGIAGDREETSRWTLLEAEIPGAVCTIAVCEPSPDLEVRRFTPAELGLR